MCIGVMLELRIPWGHLLSSTKPNRVEACSDKWLIICIRDMCLEMTDIQDYVCFNWKVFMTLPHSRINPRFCSSIVWFIFNLQRKNKESEIALGIYTSGSLTNAVFIIYVAKTTTWATRCAPAQSRNEYLASCPWITNVHWAVLLNKSVL